ncbi:hypothetical protein QKW35_06100 [Pontibacterium granulatum]|uniref:hypothetical protein n=1 Tax=Pontibacterium granulatum TaxID=2036029 RepID=UPI00249BCB7D|nr:hypothetical protein [Pontibacterium granulatum]MDI3323941.1 hypothetical protein [Pontibacterium granulatum]
MMIQLDKKMRFVCRVFAIGFGAALISMLDGAYSYNNIGHTHVVSASGSPLKFWFAVVWESLIFVVTFYLGFIAKPKPE